VTGEYLAINHPLPGNIKLSGGRPGRTITRPTPKLSGKTHVIGELVTLSIPFSQYLVNKLLNKPGFESEAASSRFQGHSKNFKLQGVVRCATKRSAICRSITSNETTCAVIRAHTSGRDVKPPPVQSKGSGRYFVADDRVRHKVFKRRRTAEDEIARQYKYAGLLEYPLERGASDHQLLIAPSLS
jgi:hypothetical protein